VLAGVWGHIWGYMDTRSADMGNGRKGGRNERKRGGGTRFGGDGGTKDTWDEDRASGRSGNGGSTDWRVGESGI